MQKRGPLSVWAADLCGDKKMMDKVVLCGASSYEQKYYFNEEFKSLPQSVQDELHIMCVLFTEDVGGVLTLEFDDRGRLEFKVVSEEGDYLFDEIGRAHV